MSLSHVNSPFLPHCFVLLSHNPPYRTNAHSFSDGGLSQYEKGNCVMELLDQLLQRIAQQPETIEFTEAIATINAHYIYQDNGFHNGLDADALWNAPGTNTGSARIFAFAQQHGLDEESTLACFGRYYREDVLRFPDGNDHANIRRFMKHGWQGIRFEGEPLTLREQ